MSLRSPGDDLQDSACSALELLDGSSVRVGAASLALGGALAVRGSGSLACLLVVASVSKLLIPMLKWPLVLKVQLTAVRPGPTHVGVSWCSVVPPLSDKRRQRDERRLQHAQNEARQRHHAPRSSGEMPGGLLRNILPTSDWASFKCL